jgi:hypothetical protein
MAFDQNKYVADFNKENYDRIIISVPKGMKDDVKTLATREGLSVNNLFKQAIYKAYGLDLWNR